MPQPNNAPRSFIDRSYEAWRNPGRFTKNPEIALLPSMLLVYADNDAHWSLKNQIVTILRSDDHGKTWERHAIVDEADLSKGDERLVTPRISRLSDGRLVVICDHNDYGYFHEDQPSGNWLYWSEDDGLTWSAPQKTTIAGFEPDRIAELPNGRLATICHVMRGDTQTFALVITFSDDSGKTWGDQRTIGHDGYHFFCEGMLITMSGDAGLACVMRENHSAGIPSHVSFSDDMGLTWSVPKPLPFSMHRPFARQLSDGRVLVTGRHVNGPLGTFAWCGDLRAAAGQIEVGGPQVGNAATMTEEGLVLVNESGASLAYSLYPPENSYSEVDFTARLRVEGAEGTPVAMLVISNLHSIDSEEGVTVEIAPDRIIFDRTSAHTLPFNFTDQEHEIGIHHKRGLIRIVLDGKVVHQSAVLGCERTAAQFHGASPLGKRTQFGQIGRRGRSIWKEVSYRIKNRRFGSYEWNWSSKDGKFPDQYQRDNMIQLCQNHPDQKPWPDHGYSSWVEYEKGRIAFVDYLNFNDLPDTSHLYGMQFDVSEL